MKQIDRTRPRRGDDAIVKFGETLRTLRLATGMSLMDVQKATGGHWNAVVVGSYERADRRLSLGAAAALLEFYGYRLVIDPEVPEVAS